MYTNSLQTRRRTSESNAPAEVLAHVYVLQQEVQNWMNTFNAWDERKHPAILQFLKDIYAHCADFNSPAGVPLLVIKMELDRLDNKIADPTVHVQVEELKKALDSIKNLP